MFYNEKAVISTMFNGHTPMTGSLFISGILGVFISIYRFFVVICLHLYDEPLEGFNNFTAVFAIGLISVWCILYANFRIDDDNWYKRKKIMKKLSIVACIFCLFRAVTSSVYFSLKADWNIVTGIYIVCDILMWVALTFFFYYYWKDKKKHSWNQHDDVKKKVD